MKKAFVTAAVFTMTGMLLAGCSAALPVADMTLPIEQPTAAIVDVAEESASNDEHIFLSDSKTDIDITKSSLPSDRSEDTAPAILPVSEEPGDAESGQEEKPQVSEESKARENAGQTQKPADEEPKTTTAPKETKKPVASATLEIITPETPAETPKPAEPEPTPQPEKPVEPSPTPAVEPTPAPEPTPEPQDEMEAMGGSFNSAALGAVNEARALSGNAPLSLDSGLCAKALSHAKEMARQGKIFHGCGGVESVSDSNESGRLIGTRSAIHASDLELNAGLTRLGVGSVKIGDKQYTCIIGR